MGPGAGKHGGEIVVSGQGRALVASRTAVDHRAVPVGEAVDPGTGDASGAGASRRGPVGTREQPPRTSPRRFPVGCLSCVTGVSGSGKSTLVNDILMAVADAAPSTGRRWCPGRHKKIEGVELLDKVVDVDQSPIGRSPRSNPATYSGVYDHFGRLFGQTQEAKVRGSGPPGSLSTSRAAGARSARATARSRSR